jgi:hypothetical protein
MPVFMYNRTELNTTYNKLRPIYEPLYVILHVGNLMGAAAQLAASQEGFSSMSE